MLPVTVIIPTRNNELEIEKHIDSCYSWLDKVQQIVVVDSSDDGTLKVIKNKLSHHKVNIYTCPPGLYTAWNHALSKSIGRWILYSTVGDYISLAEIEKLLEAADRTKCDVVTAPPMMLDEHGSPSDKRWPVHFFSESLRQLGLSEIIIPNPILSLICGSLIPHSLLGSSASNLYSAEFLKKHPWPIKYGHRGDCAWLCQNSKKVKICMLAETIGKFIVGSPLALVSRAEEIELSQALYALMQEDSSDFGDTAMVLSGKEISAIYSGFLHSLSCNFSHISQWILSEEKVVNTAEEQRLYIAKLEAEVDKLQRTGINRLASLVGRLWPIEHDTHNVKR